MGKARVVTVCGDVKLAGFRRFVWSNAKRLGLRGYVRNLPGDCVEILAVGPSGAVDELLDRIKRAGLFNVTSILIKEAPSTVEYRDFEILV